MTKRASRFIVNVFFLSKKANFTRVLLNIQAEVRVVQVDRLLRDALPLERPGPSSRGSCWKIVFVNFI